MCQHLAAQEKKVPSYAEAFLFCFVPSSLKSSGGFLRLSASGGGGSLVHGTAMNDRSDCGSGLY